LAYGKRVGGPICIFAAGAPGRSSIWRYGLPLRGQAASRASHVRVLVGLVCTALRTGGLIRTRPFLFSQS